MTTIFERIEGKIETIKFEITEKRDENLTEVAFTMGYQEHQPTVCASDARQEWYEFLKEGFRINHEYAERALASNNFIEATRGYIAMNKISRDIREKLDNGEYPEKYRSEIESFENSTRRMLKKLIITA